MLTWLDIALGVGAGLIGRSVLAYVWSFVVRDALAPLWDWRDGYRRPWPWSPFRSRVK